MGLQHRENSSRNNASTIKWVPNTGRIQQGTMHQPSNGVLTTGRNTAGNNHHQPSNGVFNTGRIQQETMHQPSNGSSTQENTAGNNASTIKWVLNTERRISNGSSTQGEQLHQPSNESSTQENTAVTMHQPSNESTTQGRIQQGTMHQPSNGSSTQGEYSREQCIAIHQMGLQHRRIQWNNASTIKMGLQHRENSSREQCINHQMGLQHRENTAGNNASTIK
ncbi:unnamed protein product [Mytilus edulis]|uniref:Uncharacterized protein n=1 Tax=Mytilus edulis TaxID=6550 RepID=A0A8S3TCZ6_MYTED|nr:unnamed protein product [Mytilus edulis]